MKAVNIANQEADEGHKYAAYLNARMTSTVNQSLFTHKQQLAATRMKLALELCYNAKEVYVTYRKTGIAVKVDGVKRVDYKHQLKQLEADYEAAGYKKKKSTQGFTYWIPR